MKKKKSLWKLIFEQAGPKTIHHHKYGRIVKPKARQLTRKREPHKHSSDKFWIAVVSMIIIGLLSYAMITYWQPVQEEIEEEFTITSVQICVAGPGCQSLTLGDAAVIHTALLIQPQDNAIDISYWVEREEVMITETVELQQKAGEEPEEVRFSIGVPSGKILQGQNTLVVHVFDKQKGKVITQTEGVYIQ